MMILKPRMGTQGCSLAMFTIVLLGACSICRLPAQTNHPSHHAEGNRYLLVFEKSRAMDRRTQGAIRTLQGLLGSGLNGQIKRGDSLGVWTFNERLYTGQMPLQTLAPDTGQATASALANFLSRQKFAGQPRFEAVWPTLQHLAASSQVLTILLISSGAEDIHGTPFDEQINASFRQWRTQQEKERMPFVVLLRGVKGKLTQCAVTAAPWPLEVPPLPVIEPPPAENIAKATPPPATPKPAPATRPPLIVTGKKPQPAAVPATNQPALAVSAAPAPVVSASTPEIKPLQVAEAKGPVSETRTPAPSASPPQSEALPVQNLRASPPPEPSAIAVVPHATVPSKESAAQKAEVAAVEPAKEASARKSSDVESENKAPAPGHSGADDSATKAAKSDSPPTAQQKSLLGTVKGLNLYRLATYSGAGVLIFIFGMFLLKWRAGRVRAARRPISLITRSLDRGDR